jgi:hypothetical protein
MFHLVFAQFCVRPIHVADDYCYMLKPMVVATRIGGHWVASIIEILRQSQVFVTQLQIGC